MFCCCFQEQKTSSESCSPSSREPWTSPTPSLRKPASSSCPSWWSCGVRSTGKDPTDGGFRLFLWSCSALLCFYDCCLLIWPAGGKDGMVGFPDFIYKHIVPACFLAPLKPTFDLSDAQTVLVRFSPSVQPSNAFYLWAEFSTALLCFSDAVRVCSHAENDSSQKGKNS